MIDTAREDELLRIILEQDDQRKLDLTELAAIRKALDDRRTVEGWVFGRLPENRRVSVTAFDPAQVVDHRCEITLWEDGVDVCGEFAETPDESFSAAAEWVRGQS